MTTDDLASPKAGHRNKSSVSIPSVVAIPPTPVSALETESNDYIVPETPTVAVSTASGRKEVLVDPPNKADQLLSPTIVDDAASTTSSHRSHFRTPSASHILGKLKKKRSRSDSVSSQRSDISENLFDAFNEKLVDELQIHYAHLGKHVRDVRIVSPPPEAPKLAAFKSSDENGKKVTNWSGYVQAVSNNIITLMHCGKNSMLASDLIFLKQRIQHIVDSAMSNKVDDVTEPFTISRLRSNAERMYTVTEPLHPWALWLRKIYRWENKVETGFWLWVRNTVRLFDVCGLAWR